MPAGLRGMSLASGGASGGDACIERQAITKTRNE
jgi:hypothetical protein